MHFLTDVDQFLFSYGTLVDRQALLSRSFWDRRLSCKGWFLLRHGLHDERLDYSIDVELGYRLAAHGLEVRYVGHGPERHGHDLSRSMISVVAVKEKAAPTP